MVSVNYEAMKVVRRILESPEALNVTVAKLANGATVIDMGQKVRGGWLAGKYYTEITLGGLGEVSYESFPPIKGIVLPAVRIMVDLPLEACIGAQIAGWRLEAKRDAPILAGPARSLNAVPDHYFDYYAYRDHSAEGVIAIQTAEPVTEAMAETIAQACSIKTRDLYILVAPNTSLVCAIQVAARIIEQTLHRVAEEGFDLHNVRFAEGFGVIPPLAHNDLTAMGRINDSLLYGGICTLHVEARDEDVQAMIGKVTSSACKAYGRPFAEIYEDAGRDFYNIPMDLHSPAVLYVNNLTSGRTFAAGAINYDVLQRSFFGN